ncbi:hypothetical protein NL108_000177, partial [Boleophthalmus pectinirostris]
MQNDTSEALRQDLTCAVCQSIFSDPVLLPCTHSFCRECLQRSLQVSQTCPFCREPCTEDQTIVNRDLKNACETFVKQTNWKSPPKPSEFCCTLHLKPLELYCELDERLVCVDCATSHSAHRLLSIKDGVPLCKVFTKSYTITKLCAILCIFITFSQYYQHFCSMQKQAGDAENQIKEEFERLHNFLHAQENIRLQTLATEMEVKMSVVQEKISTTEEHLKSLKEHLDTLKKELDNEDLPFLMFLFIYFLITVFHRTYWSQRVPKIEQDCLLTMSKHVGSLGFNIWKSMKDCVQYCKYI